MRAELDKELAAAGAARGETLTWSAAEVAVLELICDEIDRKSALLGDYEAAEDAKARVRLSAEARLLEGSIARLLRQIKTDIPEAPSRTTVKAQHAANTRWSRHAAH